MEYLSQKRVGIFLVLLIVLTVIVHYWTELLSNPNVLSFVIMWIPGVAAIVTGIFTQRPIKAMGWSLSLKWMVIGWTIPLLYAFIAYGMVWILGLGGVPNPTFLERARLTLGMTDNRDWLIIVSAFFYITVFNLIPSLIMGLGEELGWRGFLVPELTQWVGFKRAGILSGFIWGFWHLPGILSGNYGAAGTPLLYQIFCFSILVVSTAVILAWLRLKSKSIWPVAIFHATHNGVIQVFLDRITYDKGYTAYFIGEFGIALPIVVFFFG